PSAVRKWRAHRWRYRSRLPCRISPAPASNNPARDGRGTAPCSARREWARGHEFLRQSLRAGSCARVVLFAALRRAGEHFDQVVVQAVEELALEGPFELWMV